MIFFRIWNSQPALPHNTTTHVAACSGSTSGSLFKAGLEAESVTLVFVTHEDFKLLQCKVIATLIVTDQTKGMR